MVLVIDIGNTHMTLGVFSGNDLVCDWRIMTDQHRTADEYGMVFETLFAHKGLRTGDIQGIIISCVVPPLRSVTEQLCVRYFHVQPLFVDHAMDTGITICYEPVSDVGADRIVNAAAAYHTYKQSAVVVDFGTATTFDYITPDGKYVGGVIAPGIAISSEALFRKASKLPRVDFVPPTKVIGGTTVESMQSGIIFGYVSLVDGLVERILAEACTDPVIIATGGLARLIASYTKTINDVDENLTLKGLKILYERTVRR